MIAYFDGVKSLLTQAERNMDWREYLNLLSSIEQYVGSLSDAIEIQNMGAILNAPSDGDRIERSTRG